MIYCLLFSPNSFRKRLKAIKCFMFNSKHSVNPVIKTLNIFCGCYYDQLNYAN